MRTYEKSIYQKKKHRIVEYIAWHWKQYAKSPTYRDIKSRLEISSTSMVKYYLDKMLDEGLIENDHGSIYPPKLREMMKSVIAEYWKREKRERKWKSK